MGLDIQSVAGAGAAGGLGGGCVAFLNARLISGIDQVKACVNFDSIIQDADLIITGEGKVDQQTSQGKVVDGIVKSARSYQIPVIVLTGNCMEENEDIENDSLVACFSIHPAPVSLKEALEPSYTARQIGRVAQMACKLFQNGCRMKEFITPKAI